MTNKPNNIVCHEVKTLSDIASMKDVIRREMQDDEEKITSLWDSMVHGDNVNPQSPTQRIFNMMNVGTGLVDGLLLGWKLYRKYQGISDCFPLFRKKRKH